MGRRDRDLAPVLEAIYLREALLVGGPMGGDTTWSYLAQAGTVPIAGIVNVDQTPAMLNTDNWPHGFYDCNTANIDLLRRRHR